MRPARRAAFGLSALIALHLVACSGGGNGVQGPTGVGSFPATPQSTVLNAAGQPVPGGLTCDHGARHCYIFIADTLPWADAAAAAPTYTLAGYPSAHLVQIKNRQENDLVKSVVANATQSAAWIGATQDPGAVEPAGGWRWVTGDLMHYSNWAPGEPNDDGVENCLWTNPNGTWNDAPCHFTQPYVVEFER